MPFPKKKTTQDPRRSIEERYESKETYLAKVKAVLQQLVAKRFLSEEDLESQLKQSAARWDWVVKQSAK